MIRACRFFIRGWLLSAYFQVFRLSSGETPFIMVKAKATNHIELIAFVLVIMKFSKSRSNALSVRQTGIYIAKAMWIIQPDNAATTHPKAIPMHAPFVWNK